MSLTTSRGIFLKPLVDLVYASSKMRLVVFSVRWQLHPLFSFAAKLKAVVVDAFPKIALFRTDNHCFNHS